LHFSISQYNWLIDHAKADFPRLMHRPAQATTGRPSKKLTFRHLCFLCRYIISGRGRWGAASVRRPGNGCDTLMSIKDRYLLNHNIWQTLSPQLLATIRNDSDEVGKIFRNSNLTI